MGHEVGNDDTDDAGGLLAQALGEGVGPIVACLGQRFDAFLHLLAHFVAAMKRARHRGHTDAELRGQVFEGCAMLFHGRKSGVDQ